MGRDQVGTVRAVFLDRDGVINKNVLNPATGEYESPGRVEDFVLVSNAIRSLKRLQAAGYLLFLISNQPNYARGKSSLEQLREVHASLAASLDEAGIRFAEFFYCFHHPKGIVPSHSGPCDCRKPSPFFLRRAAADFGVSLEESWMVGDRATDVECGRAAGVRTVRVLEDHPAVRAGNDPAPSFEAGDLSHAVSLILDADRKVWIGETDRD